MNYQNQFLVFFICFYYIFILKYLEENNFVVLSF